MNRRAATIAPETTISASQKILVVEVIDDHPAEHEPRPAPDSERRADQPDPGRHPLGRELVADDSEREREHGSADSLDSAAGNQHLDRLRDGGDERSEREHAQRDDEQPVLSEHVAEPPHDRGRDRGREQIAREDERDRGARGVELPLDLGQRGDDHRLRQRVRHRADEQHREREAVRLTLAMARD